MKLKILIIIFAISTCCAAILYDMKSTPETIAAQTMQNQTPLKQSKNSAPDFTITNINGTEISLHNLPQDVILLNFWATWCAPCMKEFPAMFALVDKYQGKVGLLALSIDDDAKKIPPFLKKLEKITKKKTPEENIYWALDDDAKISRDQYATTNIPETIIIDKKRNMVKKIIGIIDWQSPETISMIDAIINEEK